MNKRSGFQVSRIPSYRVSVFFLLCLVGLCIFCAYLGNSAVRAEELPPSIFLPFITGSDQIHQYIDEVDQNRVKSVTQVLVEDYAPRHKSFFQIFQNNQCLLGGTTYPNHNLIRSSKYIYSLYQTWNYPSYKEWVDEEGWENTFNVVAEKIGSEYPNVYIDLGAHIDTRESTPGASDNAAGVAAIVEIARVLQNYSNRYSWRFISFIGEEYGFVGSRSHIQQAIDNQEEIKAGLILDGIGWSEIEPENMNCLWDNRDPVNRQISYLFDEVRQQYQIDISWRLCQPTAGMWSDNAAYWDSGFPAVVSIGGLPYNDPNFHKCGDNMHNVDIENAYKTAMENLGVLLKLDAEDYSPTLSPVVIESNPLPPEAISH